MSLLLVFVVLFVVCGKEGPSDTQLRFYPDFTHFYPCVYHLLVALAEVLTLILEVLS